MSLASAQAQKVKADGYMDSLKLTTVSEDQAPVQVELSGLTLASNLTKSTYGYYTGDNTVELSNGKTTFGPKQSVLGFKKFRNEEPHRGVRHQRFRACRLQDR